MPFPRLSPCSFYSIIDRSPPTFENPAATRRRAQIYPQDNARRAVNRRPNRGTPVEINDPYNVMHKDEATRGNSTIRGNSTPSSRNHFNGGVAGGRRFISWVGVVLRASITMPLLRIKGRRLTVTCDLSDLRILYLYLAANFEIAFNTVRLPFGHFSNLVSTHRN